MSCAVEIGALLVAMVLTGHAVVVEQREAAIKAYCSGWGQGWKAEVRQGDWGCVQPSGRWGRVNEWEF